MVRGGRSALPAGLTLGVKLCSRVFVPVSRLPLSLKLLKLVTVTACAAVKTSAKAARKNTPRTDGRDFADFMAESCIVRADERVVADFKTGSLMLRRAFKA